MDYGPEWWCANAVNESGDEEKEGIENYKPNRSRQTSKKRKMDTKQQGNYKSNKFTKFSRSPSPPLQLAYRTGYRSWSEVLWYCFGERCNYSPTPVSPVSSYPPPLWLNDSDFPSSAITSLELENSMQDIPNIPLPD